jgi:two-component system sensor histidine kinase VicK
LANNNSYPDEKTEVIRGLENIIKATLTRVSLTKHTIDSCIDKDNPKTIMTHNRIISAIIHIKNRGIRSRVITEITKDNLSYCKELINLTSEVRHLEDVIGNFSISDKSIYQATAMGDFSRLVLSRPR